MKKTITNSIKTLALILLMFSAFNSQAQCNAQFTVALGANGTASFVANPATSSLSPITYYWTFSSAGPTFTGTGNAGMTANFTYTANGTYVVTLFILQSSPSCSTQTQQTITISSVSSTCNINANFNYTQGASGLVNFNNTTTGTVSGVTYSWNFGDNTTPSTATSPVHTYSANGTYIATLTANNNLTVTCASTKTLAIVVNSYCTLNAGFTYSTGSNGSVAFFNNTTPSVSVSYTWTYGSSGSNAVNPVFNFPANGTYTVMLNASSGICNSTFSAVITITNVSTCNLVANFNYTQGSNGTINFNNTTTGASGGVSYSWAFGNGSTSSATSPANTYTANGTYIATLTANNNTTPACVSTKTLAIFVNSICNLVAGFNYTVGANGVVNFQNTSTGTTSFTSYSWNFGTAPTSTVTNPSHTYFNGTYTVILTASSFSPFCTDTVAQVITVSTNTCVANANFTLLPTSTPKFWNAMPASASGISAASWNWGDGNTSNTLYTSHLYSVSATYTICLSVTLTCGASANYCSSYFIYKNSTGDNSEMLQVNVIEPGSTGIKITEFDNNEYSIYPNPSSGQFNVKMNVATNEKVKLSVYSIMGQKVIEATIDSNNGKIEKQIDLSKEVNGVYFVEINSAGKTYSKKIIINK